MKLKIILLGIAVGLGWTSIPNANSDSNDKGLTLEGRGQKRWDESNCAHITADGGCAHPTGPRHPDQATEDF